MTVETGDISYYFLVGDIADISTAGQEYFAVPQDGMLKEVRTILHNAITVADAVLTVKKNGTAIGSTITVATAASAAGDQDFGDFATEVVRGDNIEVETDGGSTTAAKLTVMLCIDRGR